MVILRLIAWLIACAAWTILGLFVCIPLLFLGMLLFVASAILGAVFTEAAFLQRGQALLESVSRLFPEVYRRITQAIFSPQEAAEEWGSSERGWPEALLTLGLGTLVVGLCLAVSVAFWTGVSRAVVALGLYPTDKATASIAGMSDTPTEGTSKYSKVIHGNVEVELVKCYNGSEGLRDYTYCDFIVFLRQDEPLIVHLPRHAADIQSSAGFMNSDLLYTAQLDYARGSDNYTLIAQEGSELRARFAQVQLASLKVVNLRISGAVFSFEYTGTTSQVRDNGISRLTQGPEARAVLAAGR